MTGVGAATSITASATKPPPLAPAAGATGLVATAAGAKGLQAQLSPSRGAKPLRRRHSKNLNKGNGGHGRGLLLPLPRPMQTMSEGWRVAVGGAVIRPAATGSMLAARMIAAPDCTGCYWSRGQEAYCAGWAGL